MSDDDPPEPTTNPQNAVRPQATPPPRRSLFEIPPPLKRIFDKFPLVTYGENALPLRAPSKRRDEHVLYIFATAEDARKGRPSFNPACLRWQVRNSRVSGRKRGADGERCCRPTSASAAFPTVVSRRIITPVLRVRCRSCSQPRRTRQQQHQYQATS